MIEKLDTIGSEAATAISAAADLAALEEVRVQFLGRKAELTTLLRGIADLPPEKRGAAGKHSNQIKRALETQLEQREAELSAAAEEAALAAGAVDVTLPADPAPLAGSLHLLTQTRREIEDVFVALGFSVLEGPEVEFVSYNFDGLNHDPSHPARHHSDTFYLAGHDDIYAPGSILLRTHTSPVQIRAMQAQPPPIQVIVPGRVFRRDSDATHTPQFHQIEGLAVGENITLADLSGTLLHFAQAIFGSETKTRLRPHFFPFTEPSVEVDVSCFLCSGTGEVAGSRCSLCRGSGWIEVLGAGMVDPNLFAGLDGYDPEVVQGFAFGLGVERVAMLKHGVPDLRLLYEGDQRFLEQFA